MTFWILVRCFYPLSYWVSRGHLHHLLSNLNYWYSFELSKIAWIIDRLDNHKNSNICGVSSKLNTPSNCSGEQWLFSGDTLSTKCWNNHHLKAICCKQCCLKGISWTFSPKPFTEVSHLYLTREKNLDNRDPGNGSLTAVGSYAVDMSCILLFIYLFI